jgi:outer membrane protein OmpA-like peptidoglycan-associated protein
LALRVDMPLSMLPMLAPQVGYSFDFLPGKSGLHAATAGVRVRILNDESGWGLGGLWPARAPKGSWHGNLYLEGNLGYVHAPTVGGDAHWFGFGFGLGYQVSLASPLQLGPYVRYQHVVFKGAEDPVLISFGVSIAFGYPKKIPKTVKDEKKAAPPEKMAEPRLAGKPGDKDGDGVGDATDLCPISAPKVAVDQKGCMELRGKMIFPEVLFSKGGLRLSGEALLTIKRLSDVLKAHSDVYVRVLAFADDGKSAAENQKLAQARAQKIVSLLKKHGIQAARLQAVGSRPTPPPPGVTKTPWWDHRVVFRMRMGGFASSTP